MSGFADRQPQMPPLGPLSGVGNSEPAAGNILTSGMSAAEPERLAQTTAPTLSPSSKAVPAAAVTPLTPTEREQLFQQYLQNLAPREGGTSNRPVTADPGRLTHEGVSTQFLDSYRMQNPQLNLPADPRNLSAKQRSDIARAEFFGRAKVADVAAIPGVMQQVPQLPEQLFDSAFLHGPEDAGKFLQKALDKVLGTDLRGTVNGKKDYDGIVGSKTRAAIAEAVRQNKLRAVNNEMSNERWEHMKGLSNFQDNAKGWERRKNSFVSTSP